MNTSLPSLRWRQVSAPEIQCIEALGEGDFCTCYLINRTHVLRLAKHAQASASLRREMRLLPHLEQHLDVKIPQIQGAGTRVDTGEQFVFYPLIPGTIVEPEVLSSLDGTCRLNVVAQMAEFTARLHSFPVDTARSCGLKEIDPRHYLPEMMRRANQQISDCLEADVWSYYRHILELYLDTPELHSYTPSLLHGDLSPEHFLADLKSCALTGVIDFGDSLIGDPHRDLIYLLEDYGKEILDLFLTFYSPATKEQASLRVQIFQQLNNVEYCLSKQSESNEKALQESLGILVTQATTQAVI
jgi:aminoglycoside 2''-phosphotransferase